MKAYFSLLDHAILNSENAILDARANDFRSTLDFSDSDVRYRGVLVYFGMVVAGLFGAFFLHDRLFSGPGSSCAGRSETDCCSG